MPNALSPPPLSDTILRVSFWLAQGGWLAICFCFYREMNLDHLSGFLLFSQLE
jgi:hypothetical protein